MTINLIANVIFYKNRLVIGYNNHLIVKLKDDFKFFKNVTENLQSKESKLQSNVVVMGRKTWDSLPCKPLKNRINIVLTNGPNGSTEPNSSNWPNLSNESNSVPIFMNFKSFKNFYKKYTPNVFVIGGSEIYKLFLKNTDPMFKPKRCWLTQIPTGKKRGEYNIANLKSKESELIYMDPLDSSYKLIGISENLYDATFDLNYRILHYIHVDRIFVDNNKNDNCLCTNCELEYLGLLNEILTKNKKRVDRTGVGTIGIFGTQMRFDISQTVPLLTTKTVPWKAVIEELLWFMRGDTDVKILQDRGVKIWNGNSTREFLDSRGLDYPEGIIGPAYGFQWRFFGAEYSVEHANAGELNLSDTGKLLGSDGVDQLAYIIDLLKNDPFSRRIILSAWNPKDLDKMALPPCHILAQFYVEEIGKEKYLSCHMYQRSQDEFLGCPFNIFSYTVLTYILAKRVGMKPNELIISVGDAHIYSNHISQVYEQLSRNPRSFPKLLLDDSVTNKPLHEITVDDFSLYGYFPHPTIKGDMAL